jgi:hypothetical protein
MKMANAVAAIMPAKTAVPNERRAPAPAPLAITRGTTPRMKANEVMRIGRSRIRAASTAASTIDRPSSRRSLANSTMRMAFFAARPISVTIPICVYTSYAYARSHTPN